MKQIPIGRLAVLVHGCIIVPLALLLLAGCGSSYPAPGVDGKKYRYGYQVVDPYLSPKLEFKDANVSITFSIDESAISYTILNLTQDPLHVESSGAMIGIDGVFQPARNTQSFYSDSIKGFPPLIVPPRGYLHDILIPRSHIYPEDGEWVEKEFFPTLDSGEVIGVRRIARNRGKKIDLILPISIGEKRKEYSIGFKIASIKTISPLARVLQKKRPPAPELPSSGLSTWGTIGVATGVAILTGAAYVAGKEGYLEK